ncbi:MAG TPA: hypothetical protein VEK06_02015 [Myxococcota bacterium]|nr:hypothetical protein [Myxococcota bacterium]
MMMSYKMDGNGQNDKVFGEIIEFLRQLEWPCQPLSRKVVRAYYKGEYGLCEVIIHIGTEDICMVIDPVVDRGGHKWGTAVLELIQAMGQEIRHIGIGVDEDGDLFVKVHLPLAHLNLERFHCLLLGLCQVAENILLPVLQANAFDHLNTV